MRSGLTGCSGENDSEKMNTCSCTSTCNTLQHTATHCTTLHHTATHCNALQHTVTHCNALQQTTPHCNTLRYTAAHCNILQHTATHCNALHHPATHCNTVVVLVVEGFCALPSPSLHNTVQCVAVRCIELQCIAECCSVLQNTDPILPLLLLEGSSLRSRALPSLSLQNTVQCVECVAVCCSVLQCVAVCCSVLQCATTTTY